MLSTAAFRPTAAAAPTSAIKLWPHACPILGRASYSHKNPMFITGSASLPPTGPHEAWNAVSSLKCGSTLQPVSSWKKRTSMSWDCLSSYASSGQLHMAVPNWRSLSLAWSMEVQTCCFSSWRFPDILLLRCRRTRHALSHTCIKTKAQASALLFVQLYESINLLKGSELSFTSRRLRYVSSVANKCLDRLILYSRWPQQMALFVMWAVSTSWALCSVKSNVLHVWVGNLILILNFRVCFSEGFMDKISSTSIKPLDKLIIYISIKY